MFDDDVLSRCSQRLRYLQSLYCGGKIPWGSPEHFEILAVEELESLCVREKMRRLYEAQQRLEERVAWSPRPLSNPDARLAHQGALHDNLRGVCGAASRADAQALNARR